MSWPRGEFEVKFTTKSGVAYRRIVPNQFTIFGMQSVIKAAFQGVTGLWYMGLCAHNPADILALQSLGEPKNANGYVRQQLPLTSAHWPTVSNVNGESYVESRQVTFPISADLDTEVNRLFLTDGTQVIAISSPFDSGGLQLLNSPLTTRYRLYFR